MVSASLWFHGESASRSWLHLHLFLNVVKRCFPWQSSTLASNCSEFFFPVSWNFYIPYYLSSFSATPSISCDVNQINAVLLENQINSINKCEFGENICFEFTFNVLTKGCWRDWLQLWDQCCTVDNLTLFLVLMLLRNNAVNYVGLISMEHFSVFGKLGGNKDDSWLNEVIFLPAWWALMMSTTRACCCFRSEITDFVGFFASSTFLRLYGICDCLLLGIDTLFQKVLVFIFTDQLQSLDIFYDFFWHHHWLVQFV